MGGGVLVGLKCNKPELYTEVDRVLNIERRRVAPQAESPWEVHKSGLHRHRLWRSSALERWSGWTHLRQVAVVEQTWNETGDDGKQTGDCETVRHYFVTTVTSGMLHREHLSLLVGWHWAIENDCNWTFDVQFGEEDRAWSAQNKSALVFGVVRKVAYNMLQHRRKCHAQVASATDKRSPRPWVDLAEWIRDALRDLDKRLGPLAVALNRASSGRADSWAKSAVSIS